MTIVERLRDLATLYAAAETAPDGSPILDRLYDIEYGEMAYTLREAADRIKELEGQ